MVTVATEWKKMEAEYLGLNNFVMDTPFLILRPANSRFSTSSRFIEYRLDEYYKTEFHCVNLNGSKFWRKLNDYMERQRGQNHMIMELTN